MKKVYLAGPTVFKRNCIELFEQMRNELLMIGVEALIPVDGEATSAQQIALKNMKLIQECDYVFADLSPFRGTEPDSGTAFEVGYAIALNKCVIAYNVKTGSYKSQVQHVLNISGNIDRDEYEIEDFGHPLNLMLSCNVNVVGDFDDCVKFLSNCLIIGNDEKQN